MLCALIFITEWRDLQFKVDSEQQIFEKFFSWQFYLFSEFLPGIYGDEVAEEVLFVFYFDVWPGARTLAFARNLRRGGRQGNIFIFSF